jgi:hypothetical protein
MIVFNALDLRHLEAKKAIVFPAAMVVLASYYLVLSPRVVEAPEVELAVIACPVGVRIFGLLQ